MVYILVFWPQGTWDLSLLTRDQTHTHPALEGKGLNQWTAREFPKYQCLEWNLDVFIYMYIIAYLLYIYKIFILYVLCAEPLSRV